MQHISRHTASTVKQNKHYKSLGREPVNDIF